MILTFEMAWTYSRDFLRLYYGFNMARRRHWWNRRV